MAEGQLGIHLTGTEFKRWSWYFRNQPEDDFGIDCHVEVPGAGYATGRLIGLQVKTGRAKYFRKPAKDGAGWYYGPDLKKNARLDKHLRYWLEHDLPVVVILVDDVSEEIYWEHVTLDRVIFTGGSWKILVPKEQRLNADARPAFEALVQGQRRPNPSILTTASHHLPPDAAKILLSLEDTADFFKALQLAVLLSQGRHAPGEAVEGLLANADRFLRDAAGRLAAAVAVYAADHGYPLLAARAYTEAADQAPHGAGRYHAFAAWSWVQAREPREASSSLATAEAAGAPSLLCAWIRTFNKHQGPGLPTVPEDLRLASAEEAQAEPMYWGFLADAAMAVGDASGAIRFLESALEAAPQTSSLQLALVRVLQDRLVAEKSPLPHADLERVVELCSSARAQRLLWDGPSEEPLIALMHARTMAGDFPAALLLATAQPEGRATAREASCGPVAFLGVKVALSLGDTAAADLIAAACTDRRYTQAIHLMINDRSQPDRTASHDGWRDVLAGADDLDVIIHALFRVADSGLWPIARLEEQHSVGMITQAGYAMLRARSEAARGDLQTAVRRLRPHALATAIGAETLVEVLEAAGRPQEALTECRKGFTRFTTALLAARLWNLLTRTDRTEEAVTWAADLLGRSDLAAGIRVMLRRFMIGHAWQQRDWSAVEVHSRALLQQEPDHLLAQWEFIAAAFYQQRWPQAWARLNELNPAVAAPVQGALWLDLHGHFGFSDADVSLALDLIDRWPDEHDLHGQVVTLLLVQGNRLTPDGERVIASDSPEIHERFNAALAKHLARQPRGLRRADGDLAATIASQTAELSAHAPRYALLNQMHRSAVMPYRAICAAQRRPYAHSFLTRSDGPIVAVTSHPGDFDSEMRAARNALDQVVVLDTSALAVVIEIPERWPGLQGAFSEAIVTTDDRYDCLTACAELRQAPDTAAFLTYDIHHRALRYTQLSTEDLAVRFTRANALEQLLSTIDPSVDPPEAASPVQPEDGRIWLRTVRACLDRGATLWCDDLALRAHARALGCPTFGTLALLHALDETKEADTDLRRDVMQLVRGEVADLLLDTDELAALADGSHGRPGPAGSVIRRPAYWRPFPEAFEAFLHVLDRAAPTTAEDTGLWIAAACSGITAYVQPHNLEAALRDFTSSVADHRRASDEERDLFTQIGDEVAAVERSRIDAITTALSAIVPPVVPS